MLIKELIADFENYLINNLKNKDILSNNLKNAMIYSVSRGGKRLRPGFCLLTANAFKIDVNRIYPYASALEMIHEFSLVHDDLPCMDNDDMRRGKPTTHIKYGEFEALLVGDALLNLASEIAFDDLVSESSINKIKSYKFLFNKSGCKGMMDGQSFENIANDNIDDYIKTIERKTLALFEASLYGAGIYLGLDNRYLQLLGKLSKNIGIGFQIVDDKSDSDGIYNISESIGEKMIEECNENILTIYRDLESLDVNINGYKEITDLLFSKEFINK